MPQKLTLLIPFGQLSKTKGNAISSLAQTCNSATRYFLAKAQELKTTSQKRLHDTCYSEAKTFFQLNTGILQSCRDKAIACERSYLARLKTRKKASKPKGDFPIPIRCDCYQLFQSKRGTWHIKFATASGYGSQLAFPLQPRENQLKWFSKDFKQGTCEIFNRKGHWILALTITVNTPEPKGSSIIGADLGVVNMAVLSTGKFFSGKWVQFKRNHFARKRSEYQSRKLRWKVKASKGKESRWMSDVNHKLSRQIVDIAKLNNSAIAIENLIGIRERIKASRKVNRMLHSWPFAELINFVKYKANLEGVPVIEVDPRSSSRTCSRCGHIEKSNRKNQATLLCRACGYNPNADINASFNIALRASTLTGYMPVRIGGGHRLNGDRRLRPNLIASL